MANFVVRSRPSKENRILNSLSDKEYARLRPHLEHVRFRSGDILFRPGDKIDHVYFPNRAMISVVGSTPSGHCAEVSMIGSEGAAGMGVLLGSDTIFHEQVVQLPGDGWRIETSAIKQEFERHGELHRAGLGFIGKLMAQVLQTAICNRLHPIEKRLARWLLMCRDRSEDEVLALTQQTIATALGASRVRITLAANKLHEAGLIDHTRGKITIRDRRGLEEAACCCYELITGLYERAV